MVQRENIDRAFAALADPTRRSILGRLSRGEATISELAEPAGMSLTGLKKHVRVLEEANLVSTAKRGRSRYCRLEPKGFDEAGFWLEEFRRGWADRFDRLEQIIERRKGESSER